MKSVKSVSSNQSDPSSNSVLSSISTLISDSWQLYTRHAATMTIIMTVLLLITFWPFYYLKSSETTLIALLKNPGSLTNVVSFLLPLLLAFIFFFVFFAWSQVALIYVFSNDVKMGVVESLKRAFPKIIPYTLTLFCIAGVLIGGLVLLIIPGLVWVVYFVGGSYMVVTENLYGFAALSRNRIYVLGHWKAVGVRLLLLFLIWFVTNFATAMTLQITGLIENLVLEQFVFSIVNFLLLVPFFQVYGYVLHKNLVSLSK